MRLSQWEITAKTAAIVISVVWLMFWAYRWRNASEMCIRDSYITMKKITIAIDGHSSCGKSTMAKDLAKMVGYVYVDTGACLLYTSRCV